jgi:hypothetical protein
MGVHCARWDDSDPDTGEAMTIWLAATDATGPDLFLPVNQPATDADEAAVAALFDVQPARKGRVPGTAAGTAEVGGGIIFMRIHRQYLMEKGVRFLTPDEAAAAKAAGARST